MKFFRRQIARRIAALTLTLILPVTTGAFAQAGYDTLALGASGASVVKMQNALAAQGYDPGKADGKFGQSTQNALILYQKSKGLTSDGKAGTQTLSLLYEGSATDKASGTTGTTVTKTASSSKRISSDPDTLEMGDSGDRVKTLQTALQKLKYYTGKIDGKFGIGTRRAVEAFQRAAKLHVDGLAGAKTQELLYKKAGMDGSSTGTGNTGSTNNAGNTNNNSGSAANSGSTGSTNASGFTRTLRKGCKGDDVKTVQKQLKTLGYYTSTLDGDYGMVTVNAVTSFQKNNKLSVDGSVGSKTYSKLYSSGALNVFGKTGSATDSGTSSDAPSSGDNTGGSTSGDTSGYVSLSYGSTGDAVKKLQKALKDLKYNVSVDGNYGALTQSAVTAFQKLNGLTADGVAGAATQEKLYSGNAVAYNSSVDQNTLIDDSTGVATGPSVSSVKCLYWFTEVKPTIRAGQHITVFDPATKLQWTLRLYSLGHHADSEPLTATDTAIMFKAFGNTNTWTPKPVYVQLPNGVWTLASMHNVPHLNGSISDNNFNGHLCVHFLRTLEECQADDPNYGMQHQRAIRAKWKQMTGQDIKD